MKLNHNNLYSVRSLVYYTVRDKSGFHTNISYGVFDRACYMWTKLDSYWRGIVL